MRTILHGAVFLKNPMPELSEPRDDKPSRPSAQQKSENWSLSQIASNGRPRFIATHRVKNIRHQLQRSLWPDDRRVLRHEMSGSRGVTMEQVCQ